MRLHVLAGCRELLRPEVLTQEQAAALIGPRVAIATTPWLSSANINYDHTVLQDEPEDCRTAVMAMALKDGFGSRFEPLLILPELLNEIGPQGEHSPYPETGLRRSQRTVLSEIWGGGHLQRIWLYGVALPANADPEGCWAVPAGIVTSSVRNRIEQLRTVSAAETGSDAIETHVIEATPDNPSFRTLYNNALGNHFVVRLAPRLREQGWGSDAEILLGEIVRLLADWNAKGISPALPLRADDLDAMTKLIVAKLL